METVDRVEPTAEQRRIERLKQLRLLDTASEPAYDAFTKLAAGICGVPISLISLVDETRQWFKSNYGLEGSAQTPRDIAFCAHAIQQSEPMEVRDATEDPRFKENPLVLEDPRIRFYAGVPLVSQGQAIGTLCVMDRAPRNLTGGQRAQMELLAAALVELMESRIHLSLRDTYDGLLRAAKHKLTATLESLAEGVITVDQRGTIDFVNTAAERLLKRRSAALIGNRLLDALRLEQGGKRLRTADLFDDREGLNRGRATLVLPDGPRVPVEYHISSTYHGPQTLHHVIVVRDITLELRETEKLEREASHDKLTGLCNRRQFEVVLARAIAEVRRTQRPYALAFMDLDNFKPINDNHGHAAGDLFLVQLSARLSSALRENDVLARIGGDEFAVLLSESSLEQATFVMNKLVEIAAETRVPWDGETLRAGLSYGIIRIDESVPSVKLALDAADKLCYESKRAKGNPAL